jgi:O-antigen ligase
MTTSTSKNFPAESKKSGKVNLPLEPGDVTKTWASKAFLFLLCFMLVMTTVAYGGVHQPILALFYAGAALVVILWAVDAFASGFLRYNRNLVQLPIIAAIVYGLVQIIPFGSIADVAGVAGVPRTISYDPYATRFAVIHLAALLVYFAAMLSFIDSGARIKKIVFLIIIFGAAFAFFAMIQYVMSPDKIYGIYEPHFARPFGSFVNPNNFAAFMEMTIALPLGLFFAGAVERDKKLLYITGIVLMGIALVMSGSRGGFISLVAEIVFLVLLTAKTEGTGKLALRIGATAALVVCIIAGTFLLGSEKSSLTRFAEGATRTDQMTSRTHLWGVTLGLIGRNPIFGNGLNAFGVAYTGLDTYSGLERAEQAHNDYLQTLSDGGIIGGIIGLGFLLLLFRGGVKNTGGGNTFRRGVAIGALAACFAVLVHSLFDFVLHTTAIAMMFLTMAALIFVSRKSGEEPEPARSPARSQERSANVMPLKRR